MEGSARTVGITLSPEQIRTAPPDVRRWIEHEIAAAFGATAEEGPRDHAAASHLVGCDVDETAAILSLIHGTLPVVNVFVELGPMLGA